MKAKLKVRERPRRPQDSPELPQPQGGRIDPDPPLLCQDLPEHSAPISQRELLDCVNAMEVYRLARADFQMKEATIMRKLLRLSPVEPGERKVWIDGEKLIIMCNCNACGMTHRSEDTRYT